MKSLAYLVVQYKGEGKEYCAGAIICQLNDCYPCTSWAYIDYYLRPKPAFYTIRCTFAPTSVRVARTPRSRVIDNNKPYKSTVAPKFEVFAHNTTTEKKDLTLVLRAFDLYTGQFVQYENASQVSLLPGQNMELGTLANPSEVKANSLIILSAFLVDSKEAVLTRFIDWPEPFHYLNWPKGTKVTTTAVAKNNGWETVEIESNNPVKGVLLDVKSGKIPKWEDNMVGLLPGDKVQVRVKGL